MCVRPFLLLLLVSSTHTDGMDPGQKAFRRRYVFIPPLPLNICLNLWWLLSRPAPPISGFSEAYMLQYMDLDNDDIKGALDVSFTFETVSLPGLNNVLIE